MKNILPVICLLSLIAVAELPNNDDYVIGADDVLHFTFFTTRESDFVEPVRFDGKIVVPYLGEIQASGLTLGEFNRGLVEALGKYLNPPDIAVSVDTYNSCKVHVLGEVKKPGVITYRGKSSLVEIFALAGGFDTGAVKSSVLIIRRSDGGSGIIMRVDMEKLLSNGLAQLDVPIARGDIIYVPRSFIADFNAYINSIMPAVDMYLRVLYPSNILIGTSSG
jgi:protein involved in polysaccharide export with SLBB domain